MKNTTYQLEDSWKGKSEIYERDGAHKKKLFNEILNLFVKLMFRAILLAIGLAFIVGLVIEIFDPF